MVILQLNVVQNSFNPTINKTNYYTYTQFKGEIDLCHGYYDVNRLSIIAKYHNRDKNAVQNMLKIVKSIFNTGKRPEVFCRSS